MEAGKEALCASLRFRMQTSLKLLYNRKSSDLKNPGMTIGFTQFLWFALGLAAIRLQSFLDTALEQSSIGCIVLKKMDSRGFMMMNVRGALWELIKSSDMR
jgi:hypothetical protein